MQEDNLRNVSVPGSGGYQWAIIALRSLFWLHLTSGQAYTVGIPVSSLSPCFLDGPQTYL